ncbi:MAG: LysR family transcriptional regulator [Myxococcota bacterium]
MSPLPSLDSLRCFVEVAQRLNFRAAARAVALTPAAVSTRIRQLEDLVGVALFSRTTRKVALTEAGASFLPAAREALSAAERAVQAGRGQLGPPVQHVTLGTRHELGMSWVLPSLPALRAALPHVTFHLYFGSGADLLVRVAAGVLPCAIGSMKTADRRLASEPLHEETYVLVAEREYARNRPLKTERDAAQHVLIDADESLPLTSYLLETPGGAQVQFRSVVAMGTIAAVRALVLQREGVAVLPRYLVQPDLDRGRLVQLLPRRKLASDWFRLWFRAGAEAATTYAAMAEVLRRRPLR